MKSKAPTTTLAAAFVAAGYELPADKLRRLMREAIVHGKGLAEPSIDHFIATLLDEDARLVWELFADERALRVRKLFTEMLGEVRGQGTRVTQGSIAEDGSDDSGQLRPDTHVANAAVVEPLIVNSATAARLTPGTEAHGYVKGGVIAPPPPPRQSRSVEAMDKIADLSTKTAYLKMKINGQYLADITAGEARAWAKARGIELRFVALLTYDLLDETIIGHARSEAEAAEAYRLASQAANA